MRTRLTPFNGTVRTRPDLIMRYSVGLEIFKRLAADVMVHVASGGSGFGATESSPSNTASIFASSAGLAPHIRIIRSFAVISFDLPFDLGGVAERVVRSQDTISL